MLKRAREKKIDHFFEKIWLKIRTLQQRSNC